MSAPVDFTQLSNGDVRVDLSSTELLMAEQQLNAAQVGSAVQHQGGGRVPQDVTGTTLADSSGSQISRRIKGLINRIAQRSLRSYVATAKASL